MLTVSGVASDNGAQQTAQYDLNSLARMERVEFQTTTIWTDGPQTFTGVPLATLLKQHGADSGSIRAVGLNDYSVEIPIEDISTDAPIIAYLRDGKPMPRRNKGPLWIVYPFDRDANYRSETTFSRSVWQLDRIDILK